MTSREGGDTRDALIGVQGDLGVSKRAFQSTKGLCTINHDRPTTRGYIGQDTTLKAIWYKKQDAILVVMGRVSQSTSPEAMLRPSMTAIVNGSQCGMVDKLNLLTKSRS